MTEFFLKKEIEDIEKQYQVYISYYIFEVINKCKTIYEKITKIGKEINWTNDDIKYDKNKKEEYMKILDESTPNKVNLSNLLFLILLYLENKEDKEVKDKIDEYKQYYECFIENFDLDKIEKISIYFYLYAYNFFNKNKSDITSLTNTKLVYDKIKSDTIKLGSLIEKFNNMIKEEKDKDKDKIKDFFDNIL